VTFDAGAATALFSALRSKALALNVFDAVNFHEPTAQPGKGLSLSVTLGPVTPLLSSGLAETSCTVTFAARIWVHGVARAQRKPLDELDAQLLAATAALMNAYSQGFTLGGTVRDVNLMKMAGTPGWVDFDDGTSYRVMEITIPVEINDLFGQEA
jgi:hypothetical protein